MGPCSLNLGKRWDSAVDSCPGCSTPEEQGPPYFLESLTRFFLKFGAQICEAILNSCMKHQTIPYGANQGLQSQM